MAFIVTERLRRLRRERKEVQADLAAVIERDRSLVTLLENGKAAPSLDVLDAIARHYGVSPDYLLGWSDERLPVSRQGEQALEGPDERALVAAFRRLPHEERRAIEAIVRRAANTPPPPIPPSTPPRKPKRRGT